MTFEARPPRPALPGRAGHSMPRLLFVHNDRARFVQLDIEILRAEHTLTEWYLHSRRAEKMDQPLDDVPGDMSHHQRSLQPERGRTHHRYATGTRARDLPRYPRSLWGACRAAPPDGSADGGECGPEQPVAQGTRAVR